MSKTVYVIVEGPTERKFIADILAPYLWIKEIYLTPIEVGKVSKEDSKEDSKALRFVGRFFTRKML